MLDQILSHFPARTHPLTLVNDPDGVLADEMVLTELAARGFVLVQEADPVVLRFQVEQARAAQPGHSVLPLIIVTSDEVNTLPYDLWQQGHHVTLALHNFFPNLAYPVVKLLSPAQRARLAAVDSPSHRLGRQATVAYILQHGFGADPVALQQPALLVAWLDAYHQQPDPLPSLLLDALVAQLASLPAYAEWPLRDLLSQREAFVTFVREEWQRYVYAPRKAWHTEEQYVLESHPAALDFAVDVVLQDRVAGLVRSGTLAPLQVTHPEYLPGWARPALLALESDRLPRRVAELLAQLTSLLVNLDADGLWPEWQRVARAWAELTALRYRCEGQLDAVTLRTYVTLQKELDMRFSEWLLCHYAPLANKQLPQPHHVYHVPAYLAYRCPPEHDGRVALLILDGLALADWTIIEAVWRARHPDWHFDTRLVLAQVPTITPVSRQALVSGLRPAAFADTLQTTGADARRWQAFWAARGLEKIACPYRHLYLTRDGALPVEITSQHTRALCLVDTGVDDLVHDATLGSVDFYASLALWLEQASPSLERVIAGLLARDFTVILASDHGHTEACGIGIPLQGAVVQSRSQRARLYRDPGALALAQGQFVDTLKWESRGLLPADVSVLIPKGRLAFALGQTTVVTHGGITLDEVVVPLVEIM
ncbi:MAG: BREX-3 system phosphatase PglZ [Anaerolineae bacterium]|nr:BREX-3 system phosphatase PglZ [Anaerolineae bacterium]